MVQEVTTTSWGKRIMNAFAGMIIGVILIAGAFYLVFWNEGNGLHTAQSLEQAQQLLVKVPNSPINTTNDMKAVYFTGMATTDDILKDELLDVSVTAIMLQRSVEMYQWKEKVETKTEKQMGGSEQEVKTYTYEKTWSSSVIDSSGFKEQAGHQNPTSMMVESKTQYAPKVTVGDFILPIDLVKEIDGETPVDLSKIDLTELKDRVNQPVQNIGESLYVGANSQTPAVGDLKISVNQVLPQTVSVIAQQTGNTLQPFMTPAGKLVSLLYVGQMSSDEMIQKAQPENTLMMWIWRVVSLAMMIFGLVLLMQPVVILADVIPFLGSVVSVGTGFISFVGGLSLWVIATAIAWFVVRPLWSVGLVIIMVGVGYALIQRRRNKLTQEAGPSSTPVIKP